ncbi:RNA methyltransferase [Microbacterium sp. SORGH_AS_0421]|uniref:TrmH family RNA methyltransferase n=1 Tax=Microbacterium sp. SORGH_AS_0421 TaxID=3041768 RepID=UPI00278F147C|nr:RNA methyltransferase [Microbacterium sp. SORGH_AS_0421]MDQ1176080.1 tRNA G18 (ribose-2'-O)-methylase SpoU [Microbacterium sp. SORGH_AS_0421]
MTQADETAPAPTDAAEPRSAHADDPAPRPDDVAAAPAHGVGPWPGGPDAWPDDPRYDRELLENGDTRNVVDVYRYWSMDAIVADLDDKRHPFHVAIENWQHDLNIGSIVRSANAFLAAEVHIVGKRRWNRRGAMVTDRYQHVRHHEDVAAFTAWAREAGLPVIAVDNVEGSVPVDRAELPEACVLLFGQEGPGLSPEAIEAATGVVEITQYGSTRSINAASAAAVIMYEWCRRWA